MFFRFILCRFLFLFEYFYILAYGKCKSIKKLFIVVLVFTFFVHFLWNLFLLCYEISTLFQLFFCTFAVRLSIYEKRQHGKV